MRDSPRSIRVFCRDFFFSVGFHAVSLSSPTFPNFMVSASTTGVPGRTSQDAADLYRVMQLCMEQLQQRIRISDLYFTGYSLGGWQSAFVARLDDQQKALGFRRVLMINPPVSLYKSSQVLDNMLADNMPGGLQNVPLFLDEMTARVTGLLQRSRGVDLSQDFLYDVIRGDADQRSGIEGVGRHRISSRGRKHRIYRGRDEQCRISSAPGSYSDHIDFADALFQSSHTARFPRLLRQSAVSDL